MSPLRPLPLGVPLSDPSHEERRLFPRYLVKGFLRINLLVRPSFQARQAGIRDFSTSGLGLVGDHILQPGQVLAIQLPRRHAGVSGILLATVAHCTPLPDGAWLWGCRLSRPLSLQELLGLEGTLPQPDDESDEALSYPSMRRLQTLAARHPACPDVFRPGSEDFAQGWTE